MSFGTMPYQWIADGQLVDIVPRVGVTGRNTAALKCYLAIAAYRVFRQNTSILSYSDLSDITGASRPTVLEGTAILSARNIVQIGVREAKNVNAYKFSDTAKDFRKVPQDRICDCLKNISNRHARSLDALKLYLTMLYLRDAASSIATVSHKKLIEYTGVRPENVAAATSVLAACGFIHIRYSDEWSRTGHPTNAYSLLGDFEGKRLFRERPGLADRRLPF